MTENKALSVQESQFSAFNIQPQNFKEAMDICDLIAKSDFAPKDFKGKPGNIFAAGCMGHALGLNLMQSIQNIAVINGRPSIYGDIGSAILLAAGCTIETTDIQETKKSGKATCKITRPGGRTQTRTFSLEDAKTAKLWGKEGPWSTNPYRQMAWRAFWFAARDVASDLLKGFAGREEVEDFEPIEGQTLIKDAEEIPMPQAIENKTAVESKEKIPMPEAIAEKEPEQTVKADPVVEQVKTEVPPNDSERIATDFVNSVAQKTSKKGSEYYVIKVGDATYFSFFKAHRDIAEAAKGEGGQVQIKYEKTEHGNKILDIKSCELTNVEF